MKKAGAKFGPNDRNALLTAVPVTALEPFIGRFQIQSSEFHLRHKQNPRSLAQLYWEVDGESVGQDAQKSHWLLILDPFAGRFQSLTRYPK